jgi:hypothetical protein
MIFIEYDESSVPEEIRDEARRLTEELLRQPSPAHRTKFIEKHSDFWRNKVRPILMRFSNGKCWYSEARDIASVWHVDHFRPKGDVRNDDGTKRPGYWWLAFKLSNYRLAGQVMNSPRREAEDGVLLGKWDRFPLAEGSFVADTPTSDETLETAILLDPCRRGDWALITFDETGRPIPACEESDYDHQRTTTSIDLLHLDFEPLNEERRRVWNRCDEKIKRISAIMKLPAVERAYRHAEREHLLSELEEMIAEDAELSGVARACLLHSQFKWARTFATNVRRRRAAA